MSESINTFTQAVCNKNIIPKEAFRRQVSAFIHSKRVFRHVLESTTTRLMLRDWPADGCSGSACRTQSCV